MSDEKRDLREVAEKEKVLTRDQKIMLMGVMKGMQLAEAAASTEKRTRGKRRIG